MVDDWNGATSTGDDLLLWDVSVCCLRKSEVELSSKTPILRRNASRECTKESYLVTDRAWRQQSKDENEFGGEF